MTSDGALADTALESILAHAEAVLRAAKATPPDWSTIKRHAAGVRAAVLHHELAEAERDMVKES